MRKFKLIKPYPNCLIKVGNFVSFQENSQEFTIAEGKFILSELIKYTEFWEEVKEYPKIISFRNKNINTEIFTLKENNKFSWGDANPGYFLVENMLAAVHLEIYQVVTSPTDVWTINQKVKYYGETCYIDKIFFNEHNQLQFNVKELNNPSLSKIGIFGSSESKLEKVLQPIFTTEDGKDLYEGDQYWYCPTVKNMSNWSDHLLIQSDKCRTKDPSENKNFLYFGTVEAAENYIKRKQPKFSEEQIEEALIQAVDDWSKNKNKGIIEGFKQKLGI